MVAPNKINKDVNQDKLHWKVKHKTKFSEEIDFLETILIDCGVKEEDISKFLNPNRNMILDPFTMKNMKEAVELIHSHMKKGSKIAILPDNDQDGLISGAMLGKWLKEDLEQEIPDIIYVFSEGKAHGLTYDLIKNFKQGDIDLFIVPDASLTCQDAYLIQKNFPDMDLLVIDHHLITIEYFDELTHSWISLKEANEIQEKEPERIKTGKYTNTVLSVNCTDGQYQNPHLCGAGVVQKVIEAYYQTYPQECTDDCIYKYLDLVALAIPGDGMDLRTFENRYYVSEGMKQGFHRNLFFNELQERLKDEMSFGRYIGSSQWVLTPKVNGVVRFGKKGKKGELGEKEQLFYAILDGSAKTTYKPRRKSKNDPEPEEIEVTEAWNAARMAVNVKSRQDTEVRKYFKEIQEKIETNHLNENSIIFVDGTKILERGETSGLVANKLTATYFRPVVLMREKDATTYGGSARGYSKGNIENLNKVLSSYNIGCFGHENAFGVNFQKEDLPKIIEQVNKDYPLDSLYTIHDVDWSLEARKLKRDMVMEVATNYEIWGNTVPEPVFVITDLVIGADQINGYGDNNTFIRFTYNGIPFIKKYCKIEDYPKMICKSRTSFGKPKYKVRLNLICQFVLNVWEEKVNPEVKILYFDSVKDDGKDTEDDWFDDNSTRDNINNDSSSIYNDGRSVNVSDGSSNKINTERTKGLEEERENKEETQENKIIKTKEKLKPGQQIIKMSKVKEDIDDFDNNQSNDGTNICSVTDSSGDDSGNKVAVLDNETSLSVNEDKVEEPPKKKRGRPRKQPISIVDDDDDWNNENKNKVKKVEKVEEKKENVLAKSKKKVYTIDDDFAF